MSMPVAIMTRPMSKLGVAASKLRFTTWRARTGWRPITLPPAACTHEGSAREGGGGGGGARVSYGRSRKLQAMSRPFKPGRGMFMTYKKAILVFLGHLCW
jgi:hypothetical protein